MPSNLESLVLRRACDLLFQSVCERYLFSPLFVLLVVFEIVNPTLPASLNRIRPSVPLNKDCGCVRDKFLGMKTVLEHRNCIMPLPSGTFQPSYKRSKTIRYFNV